MASPSHDAAPAAPASTTARPAAPLRTQGETRQRRQSTAASRNEPLPVRARPTPVPSTPKQAKSEHKQVSFFSHLYTQPRRYTLDGIPREVHPQIQALGLQISNYCICGSHARCAAMLLALKCVVQSYKTPPTSTLNRHLNSQHLSHQLSYLKSCRPFSVSQANAIRWLKNVIAKIDPNTPEQAAKQDICRAIDTFIRERLTVADQVIADAAVEQVQDGDTIITFARSAAVTHSLQAAKKAGKRFRVVVVDSKPLFEGRSLAHILADSAIEVTYCQLNGLSQAVRGATKCLVGAHAVLANGRIYSRAGTALVAMMAKSVGANVYVCAESIKFSERIALDSVVMNELAPEDEMILAGEDDDKAGDSLLAWREKEKLQLLNPLFDITPAHYIDSIITELGTLQPGSAPVIQRMSAGAQEGEPMLV